MMTVSIFRTGYHALSSIAAAATPPAQIIFRIKLLIRSLFPIVMITASRIPTAAAARTSRSPPPNSGANPAGTSTVATLYIQTVYCLPFMLLSFFQVSSAGSSPAQYFREISFTSTMRCILVPLSCTLRMTVTASCPGLSIVTIIPVSITRDSVLTASVSADLPVLEADPPAVQAVSRICLIVSSTR